MERLLLIKKFWTELTIQGLVLFWFIRSFWKSYCSNLTWWQWDQNHFKICTESRTVPENKRKRMEFFVNMKWKTIKCSFRQIYWFMKLHGEKQYAIAWIKTIFNFTIFMKKYWKLETILNHDKRQDVFFTNLEMRRLDWKTGIFRVNQKQQNVCHCHKVDSIALVRYHQ